MWFISYHHIIIIIISLLIVDVKRMNRLKVRTDEPKLKVTGMQSVWHTVIHNKYAVIDRSTAYRPTE